MALSLPQTRATDRARTSHQLPAAAGNLQQSAAFASVGLLNVPSSTPPRPSGRKRHISQQHSGFATKAGEMGGPAGRAMTMDEAAFRHLYDRTARPLRAYLMRSCGDLALADDLLQEAYLRILRSGFEGEDDNHRKNYLYRIATNLLRDHFRRAKPESNEVPERDESPGHDEAIHLRSDVGGAMAELAPRDRQMLWLAYVEGASHQEIAKVLGLRTASIRSMLFRARQRLTKQLQARGLRPELETS